MDHNAREEREIRDLIRQANGDADKSGVVRRKTLNRLIDLTHTQNTSLKILAAKTIPGLLNDFPDQEEAAINAVYDLCEDQSATVRKEGYDAITAVSKVANKWVKRNTDVLLQLLQSDEPDEVVVVKQALIAHLDLDPRVTLGVLCDQIMPAADSLVDPDELYMRDRLRTLVLAFLAGEAKEAIVERHAVPHSEAEGVFVEGLLAAIPKLTPTDTDIIVKQLLLQLRSFQPGSSRSNALLSTLLDQAQLCLKADAKTPSLLATTRFYMDLMAYVAIEKSLGSPMDLLRFYLPTLVTKPNLRKLSSDDQIFVICNMAEALAACEKDRDTPQLSVLRNQSAEASANLFECLAKAGVAHERSRNACKVLLQCCLRRKREGWTVPTHIRAPLETLQAKSEQYTDVQELIRSLVAPDAAPSNGSDKSKPPVAQASAKPIVQDTPAFGRRVTPASSLRRTFPARDSPVASTSGSRSSSNERSSHAINKHSLGADSSPRPAKRVRTHSDDPPSLLSRLGSKGTEQRPNVARRAAQERSVSAAAVDPEQIPVGPGGFSIKGAAAKATSNLRRGAPQTGTPSSLLNRIIMDDDGGGGRSDGGARRKNHW
ncbi:hypothetical protein DFH06DRAFT_693041 [Mycena polygramma]|nr:hypothetical protein DFH06DRAFT_693041 [Mycena polygramma]